MTEKLVPLHETWAAMEKLVHSGAAKSIGLANYNTSMLRDLFSYCRVKPSVLQVELHPYNSQEKLLRFCRDWGVDVTGFSPLGAGSYLELDMATKEDSVLTCGAVTELLEGGKFGGTAAQLVLGWALQRGTSVIPKTSSVQRLKENIDLFGRRRGIGQEEMLALSNLNKNRRFNDPGEFAQGMGCFCPIYE